MGRDPQLCFCFALELLAVLGEYRRECALSRLPRRGREKFLNRCAPCACARCVPVVGSAQRSEAAPRNSKNFRSLDKVQMNGRLRAELWTLPLRADESEARSGAHGWGQAGQSAKLTERSEACACAGVGLVGEADSKRPPHRAERIAKL